MNRAIRITLAFLLMSLAAAPASRPEEAADFTYAIEINGVTCGYADVYCSRSGADGDERLDIRQDVFMMLTVLGARFNTVVETTYRVDPATRSFLWMTTHIEQGDVKIDSRIAVEGDTAVCYTSLTGQRTRVAIPEGTVLENPLYPYHLIADFVEGGAGEKTYRILSPQEFTIQENTCTRAGSETLNLAGKTYDTIIIDTRNNATGLTTRTWLDPVSGMGIKTRVLEDRVIYLADPSVKKSLELANLDSDIAARTNVSISDVPGIRYMKVRAKIEPTGLQLAASDLTVPGQTFEGTVVDNAIDGVFEIEHPRYDGSGAPPYPPGFDEDDSLAVYLQPATLIQSDDPVLVEKARELAAGSADSWEAACRLSRWVSENIGYAIPGGGTARRVYDLRAGECGGHSFLLASFCRAVGIPARVVWGCMYIPNFGGAFGQHAWNEIYMGDAGWIPVDATAAEPDFVDSGHIRVGEYQSMSTALNANEMEILDYRTAGARDTGGDAASTARYEPYVGEYRAAAGGPVLEVRVENGALAVDIPEKMVLGFDDPDENGVWKCKMSNAVYCTFNRDRRDNVEELVIHEVVQMPRRPGTDEEDPGVPSDLRPLLGVYYYAAARAEFTVSWDGRHMALFDPVSGKTFPLKEGEKEATWTDRNGLLTVSFETGPDGTVSLLELDSANRFRRK